MEKIDTSMEEKTDSLQLLRVSGEKREFSQDTVVTEVPLGIALNGEELVTILCTPEYFEELAAGYLYSEGFIDSREDIARMVCEEKLPLVSVLTKKRFDVTDLARRKLLLTPGCVNAAAYTRNAENIGLERVDSDLSVTPTEVVLAVRETHLLSELYRITGGVHSAALWRRGKILFFSEDIGRHNALDKVVGRAVLGGISPDDTLIITSGRVSSSVAVKAIRSRVPALVSRSAPTSEAVRLSEAFGVTLIGFARGSRFNVYSNAWRIAD